MVKEILVPQGYCLGYSIHGVGLGKCLRVPFQEPLIATFQQKRIALKKINSKWNEGAHGAPLIFKLKKLC